MSLYPEETLKSLITLLKVCGSWAGNSSSRYRWLYSIIVRFCFLDLVCILILISVLKSDDLEGISDAVKMLLTYFMLLVKSTNVMWRVDEITDLLTSIKKLMDNEDWMKSLNGNVSKQTLKAQKLFKIYFTLCLITVVVGMLPPFFTGKFGFKMWLPFDTAENVFMFYIVAFFQLLDGLHNISICIGLDMLPIFLVSYMIAFIETLCDQLEDLKEQTNLLPLRKPSDANSDQGLKTLQMYIRIQIEIRRITSWIEQLFSNILLSQGILSIVILCTISFSMTVVSLPKPEE